MAANSDFKLIKEKKLDEETTVKVTKNVMSGRIFVQFTSNNPRMVVQKNFQDDLFGKIESEKFLKSIKNTNQLRQYLGLKVLK